MYYVYFLISMSLFYQVLGAVKCPKIKKHGGIRLRPLHREKEPFMPNDMLIYSCETLEFTQTIKCLDDGRWSDDPYCPDPINSTCPDLGSIPHGSYNSSGSPYKVGTILAFKCENELIPTLNNTLNASQVTSPSNTPPFITNTRSDLLATVSSVPSSQILHNLSQPNGPVSIRYNLTGHRLLKCLPSSKWNHPIPTCMPIMPEPPSNLSFVLASTLLILIPILIIGIVFHLYIRWRRRQQQRERWKQYFTDYKYRHSKTSITFGNRPNAAITINSTTTTTTMSNANNPNASTTIPVTDL